ncbi:hypothetical protein [Streptomyces sp. NRRL F-4489]|uniref:hypothetical protein n=1 Tax=Streptomyces sp. NRRL F-4489 TaxID=1609095 RepID=UPI001F43CD3E|nr:hypothetical protein [Streptomyces sp. NRRL F-4489]
MPRTRGEELLLARISAAAGRAHLGRRLATYPVTAYRPRTGPFRAVRRLPGLVRPGRPAGRPNARLDLYEHGLTVAVKGRIHIVRYATTSVFRHRARPRRAPLAGPTAPAGTAVPCAAAPAVVHTLTDVERKRLVLYGGPVDGDPEDGGPADGGARAWERELERAVVRAQLPGALAALDRGERVVFGDVWMTRERVGSGAGCGTPWAQVQGIGGKDGFLVLTGVSGRQYRLGPVMPRIPNVFLFRTLAEHCRREGAD